MLDDEMKAKIRIAFVDFVVTQVKTHHTNLRSVIKFIAYESTDDRAMDLEDEIEVKNT